jgi:hypothetical protein
MQRILDLVEPDGRSYAEDLCFKLINQGYEEGLRDAREFSQSSVTKQEAADAWANVSCYSDELESCDSSSAILDEYFEAELDR